MLRVRPSTRDLASSLVALLVAATAGWTLVVANTTTTTSISARATSTSVLTSTGCISANLTLGEGEGGVVSSQGTLTRYANGASCTWRIQAPDGMLVRAWLQPFSTECGYDVLSLYDGSTVNASALLGAWSGPRTAQQGYTLADNSLLSTSSALTLLFQADSSVSASGFSLHYEATNATSICSTDWPCANGGECVAGVCACTLGFRGPLCQYGTAGYTEFLPRKHHAAAYDPVLDVMYISGGQGANQSALMDLLAYDWTSQTWSTLTPGGPAIPARSHHHAWMVNGVLVVWGGFEDSTQPAAVWTCIPGSTPVSWTVYDSSANPGAVSPPTGLYREAAALVPAANGNGSYTLYVVGGIARLQQTYSTALYAFSSITQRWTRLADAPVALVDGRFEYVPDTNTLHLLFGLRGGADLTRLLVNYRYYLDTDYWMVGDEEQAGGGGGLDYTLSRVAFASVVLRTTDGDGRARAILAHGGQYLHQYVFNESAACYTSGVLVYDVACGTWTLVPGDTALRRSGHAIILRNGTVYVIGGEDGVLHDDVRPLALPETASELISSSLTASASAARDTCVREHWCSQYYDCSDCVAKPACGWVEDQCVLATSKYPLHTYSNAGRADLITAQAACPLRYLPALDTTYQLAMADGEYFDYKLYINAPTYDIYFVTSGVSATQYNITTTILSTHRPNSGYAGGVRRSNSGSIVLYAGEAGRFAGWYVARISRGAPPYTLYSPWRVAEGNLVLFRFGVYVYTVPPSNTTLPIGTQYGWLNGVDLTAYLVLFALATLMSGLFIVMLRNSRQQARLQQQEAMELEFRTPVFELRERPRLFTVQIGVDRALASEIKQQAFRLKRGRVGQLRGHGGPSTSAARLGPSGSAGATPSTSTHSLFGLRLIPRGLSVGSLFGSANRAEPSVDGRRWVGARA